MDYQFFNELTTKPKVLLKWALPFNWAFNKLKLGIEIAPKGDSNDMISLEQRINLFHLVNDVLIHEIEGDIIELGCYVGNSAMQIQSILTRFASLKKFHVYDKFESWTGIKGNVKELFIQNFDKFHLKVPELHIGEFNKTIPAELPFKIAFVHIDAGFGGEKTKHVELMLHLLEHVYKRMSKNSICLLMDYHNRVKTVLGTDSNPGVKDACDIFFEDKPEKVNVLYGNRYSHGYFRKL